MEGMFSSGQLGRKLRLKQVIVFVLVVLFVGLGLLGSIINFETGSFSCAFTEEELPIPESLIGSKIVFEKPTYFGKTPEKTHTCVSSYQGTDGVQMIWVEFIEDLTPNRIPDNKEFSIYKRIYVSCASISCMDGGLGGDLLLLKDEQGIIYEIDPFHFDVSKWANSPEYLFRAGYYKNNLRLGDVVMKQEWPKK
jgi:hypothetical protein